MLYITSKEWFVLMGEINATRTLISMDFHVRWNRIQTPSQTQLRFITSGADHCNAFSFQPCAYRCWNLATFSAVGTGDLLYSSKAKTVWSFTSFLLYHYGTVHKHRDILICAFSPLVPGHWMCDGCQNVKCKLLKKVFVLSVGILRYLCREKNVKNHWYPTDSKQQAKVDEYLEWQHLDTRLNCSLYFQHKVSFK
jgi:hypothetical protein